MMKGLPVGSHASQMRFLTQESKVPRPIVPFRIFQSPSPWCQVFVYVLKSGNGGRNENRNSRLLKTPQHLNYLLQTPETSAACLSLGCLENFWPVTAWRKIKLCRVPGHRLSMTVPPTGFFDPGPTPSDPGKLTLLYCGSLLQRRWWLLVPLIKVNCPCSVWEKSQCCLFLPSVTGLALWPPVHGSPPAMITDVFRFRVGKFFPQQNYSFLLFSCRCFNKIQCSECQERCSQQEYGPKMKK